MYTNSRTSKYSQHSNKLDPINAMIMTFHDITLCRYICSWECSKNKSNIFVPSQRTLIFCKTSSFSNPHLYHGVPRCIFMSTTLPTNSSLFTSLKSLLQKNFEEIKSQIWSHFIFAPHHILNNQHRHMIAIIFNTKKSSCRNSTTQCSFLFHEETLQEHKQWWRYGDNNYELWLDTHTLINLH